MDIWTIANGLLLLILIACNVYLSEKLHRSKWVVYRLCEELRWNGIKTVIDDNMVGMAGIEFIYAEAERAREEEEAWDD